MTPSNITNKSVENNFLYSVPKAIQQVIANEYHYETQLIEKDSSMSPQEKIVSILRAHDINEKRINLLEKCVNISRGVAIEEVLIGHAPLVGFYIL